VNITTVTARRWRGVHGGSVETDTVGWVRLAPGDTAAFLDPPEHQTRCRPMHESPATEPVAVRPPSPGAVLRGWGWRRWAITAAAALGTAVVVAVPTAIIPTPLFGREVPVTWWSYPTLAVTAVLSGLLVATYVGAPPSPRPQSRRAWAGAALSWFAVGCPVCNKLVLLALGYNGAITWFAPVQPALALGSVGLLGWALRSRLRSAVSCQTTVAVG
jgi:hypothetical protein